MKKKMILVAVCTAVATVFPAAPSQAQTVLTVDDDGVQCPTATFTSIQDAVDAASAGDEIRVCPGQYNESVNVPDTKPNLNLVGPAVAPRGTACHQAGALNPTTQAIIENPDIVATVQLNADGAGFSRFVVKGNTSGTGIYTPATHSGYQVLQNRVEDNVFGIYFNSDSTTLSQAEQNCVRENNAAGANTGNGIYADQGLKNATIRTNTLFNHDTSGITLAEATGTVDGVDVRTNNSLQDDSLVALFDTSNVRVRQNTSRDNTGSAIFLGPDNTQAAIDANTVTRAAAGVRANALGGPLNSDIGITSNTISFSTATNGISAATDSLTQSLIRSNRSNDNAGDGIRLAAGNGDNVIQSNSANRNVVFDCRDETTGTGTAGTDNTWTNNIGPKASPPDICI